MNWLFKYYSRSMKREFKRQYNRKVKLSPRGWVILVIVVFWVLTKLP